MDSRTYSGHDGECITAAAQALALSGDLDGLTSRQQYDAAADALADADVPCSCPAPAPTAPVRPVSRIVRWRNERTADEHETRVNLAYARSKGHTDTEGARRIVAIAKMPDGLADLGNVTVLALF